MHRWEEASEAPTLTVPVNPRLLVSLGAGAHSCFTHVSVTSSKAEMGAGVRAGAGCVRVLKVVSTLLGMFREPQPDVSFLSSLPQFQILEGSTVALTRPPSCRCPPWRTCCAHTPPSPARTMPPRAVRPPPRRPSGLSSAPRSCLHPTALTGSCPRS